jgi:hypothetical protein
MNSFDSKSEPVGSTTERNQKAKKLYLKPAFRFERVFETSALSCGKTSGSPEPTCRPIGKS